MDAIDHKILSTFSLNSRITNSNLSKVIGLSESATLERVRRLENKGAIRSYTIQTDSTQMGRPLELLMALTLNNQYTKDVTHFTRKIREIPEVLSCAQVLGRFDFIIQIAVENPEKLRTFINNKLIPIGVINRMESFTILNQVKPPTPSIPIED